MAIKRTTHVAIFSGTTFTAAQCVRRIEHQAAHGWQLCCGGTKPFADNSSENSSEG